MIIDTRRMVLGSRADADLCIVGAGPAGIAIAREFVNHSARVVLLESGNTTVREENQLLCRGSISGYSYPPLHLCRRRVLGGSTTFWGGWSRPLDNIDFEPRSWVAYSGWPLSREQLIGQYARANAICKFGGYDFDSQPLAVRSAESLLKQTQNSFEHILFHIQPTKFGKAYREELEKAQNVRLMLNANVVEVEMDRDQKAACSVKVATLNGKRFCVYARNFVLAAGGLENPRILLVSRGSRDSGVGNENDLVGRFFADHLHVMLNRTSLKGQQPPPFFLSRRSATGRLRGGLALSEDARRREKLLGFGVTIHNPDNPHDVAHPNYSNLGYSSLRSLMRPFADGELPDRFGYHFRTVMHNPVNAFSLSFRRLIKTPWRAFALGIRAEQAPNPNSRVLLDQERDVFGTNKIRLDWRLGEQDLDSLRRAQRLLENELSFSSYGGSYMPRGDEQILDITGASHHIGTTRMNNDPKLGVVDETCRVHGVHNLYVTGSSVFPTSGWAPPTLTIIALALRLADHLKRSF